MKKYLTKINIALVGIAISILLFSVDIYLILSTSSNNSENKPNEVEKENPSNDEKKPNKGESNSNTNEGVISDKELGGLKFTNASLISTDNAATLTTIVENTTDHDIEVRLIYIYVKDKYDEIIIVLQGYVGDVIPSKGTRTITSNADINLDNAASIEYKLAE